MTTRTTRLTAQEWSVVAGAPLLAAMWVLAGERGGTRATLAVVSAYRAAHGDYDIELLRELLATAPADAIKRPPDRDAIRREAPAALRQARDIVERAGTPRERAEYRRFVQALADAAGHAARKGDLPGARPRDTHRLRARRSALHHSDPRSIKKSHAIEGTPTART